MKAMSTKALLSAMKDDQVEIEPAKGSEDTYLFQIDHHPFGHLDKYGNLYMDTFEEIVSQPLSLGKQTINRWINWAVKGFRINRRRIEKWQ